MIASNTVLIAGATGFVGKAVVDFLLQKGYSITILTRNTKKARLLFKTLVRVEEWPKNDADLHHWRGKSFEAIINLTGESIGRKRWTRAFRNKLIDSRVNSIKDLQQLVQVFQYLPRVWVQASAVGYYGYDFTNSTKEDGRKGDGFLANLAEEWEQALKSIELPHMRKVFLRFGVVLGSNGGFQKQVEQTFKFRFAVCPGNGKQQIPYISIKSLVRIIHQSLQDNRFKGPINVVNPNKKNLKELIGDFQMKKQVNHMVYLPQWLIRLIFGKARANELVLANQNIDPDFLKSISFNFLSF